MSDHHVLYLIACAAPPTRRIRTGIETAKAAGWDVCLILTPSAARWLELDLAELAELTGHPVRTTYKMPDEPDVLPPPDAMLVAPVTSNTMNKWAQGISDTLALGLITEAIGLRLPMVALPCLSDAQAAHPAFARGVALLRESGVTVLLNEEEATPRMVAIERIADFPWAAAVDALA